MLLSKFPVRHPVWKFVLNIRVAVKRDMAEVLGGRGDKLETTPPPSQTFDVRLYNGIQLYVTCTALLSRCQRDTTTIIFSQTLSLCTHRHQSRDTYNFFFPADFISKLQMQLEPLNLRG